MNRQAIVDFFKTQDFAKASLMVIGIVVPIFVGVQFEILRVGIFICLGVFFTSISDTTGSVRLKVNGMVLANLLAISVTFGMHFLKAPMVILIPLLGLLFFGISYLAIYGFRASLISFAGMLALVLSFSSLSHTDMSIYEQVGLIALGGAWYILLVLMRHFLFPRKETEYHLAKALELTADYLDTRSKLVDKRNDRKVMIKELLDLQTKLTENHDHLRELLISRRKDSGKSFYQARRLMVFQELVDMLELAMANPVNYYKVDTIFEKRPEVLAEFQEALHVMSACLRNMAANLARPKMVLQKGDLSQKLTHLQEGITDYERLTEKYDDEVLVLKNYRKYHKNQIDKIKKIEWLIKNHYRIRPHLTSHEERTQFIPKDDYRIKVLVENFNLRSTIFRHSLRLGVMTMIGYALGTALNVQNAYWILLTLIVIMRPNFGLTKSRFKQRTIGTIIGGVSAFIIVYFTRNATVYAVAGLVSFVIGFSMVQRNYKAAAAFITMYVLFVYALLRPEVMLFIKFRVVDTMIGAVLAFAANQLLWPSWEIKSIDKTLKSAIKADLTYLKEIAWYYQEKGEPSTAYKLSRKEAFLKMSDLSASLQRMTQEPKTQHEHMGKVFQIAMLMHSLLASLASLGTYIRHNPTTPASKDFKVVIDEIQANLNTAIKIIKFKRTSILPVDEQAIQKYLSELNAQTLADSEGDEKELQKWNSTVEEAHLVSEQLRWLLANSQRMLTLIKAVKFEH